MDKRTRAVLHHIRDALFNPRQQFIEYNGQKYLIHEKNGLRRVKINQTTFIQQNPHKDSWYAKKARQGHKIVWGIHDEAGYTYRIMDDDVRQL